MSANPTTTTPAVPGVPASTLASLRGKIDEIEIIFKAATAKIAKLLSDPAVSVQATTNEVKKAREDTDKAVMVAKEIAAVDLAQLKVQTEKERDEVMRGVARALGRPDPANATEALLRETRETRAWARLKPLLDREPAQLGPLLMRVKQLALEALAAGDEDGIAVLRAELRHYLQGRGIDEAGAVETVRQIDDLIGSERPAVAAALALQREIERGVYCVLLGINYATNALKKGTPFFAIPEWDNKGARTITRSGVSVEAGRINQNMGQPLM